MNISKKHIILVGRSEKLNAKMRLGEKWLKVLNAKGLEQTDLNFLSKGISAFWDEHGLPERTVQKVIARNHILFASVLFLLKPYEILAVKEHDFKLVYQQENFNAFMNKLAWKKGLPTLERYFKCKVEQYYSSEPEFNENALKREICIVFAEKRFSPQLDPDLKILEEQSMLLLAKKLRLKTSRGPKKCRVMILDEENTLYEIGGWLSESERHNLLQEGEARKSFESVIKKAISEVVQELETEEGFKTAKMHVDIDPQHNRVIVITYR